ncbi:stage II sporulation protein E [Sesbania bispinosa]|nr:stage II sporulation protein E [Sesbania bispinosa]
MKKNSLAQIAPNVVASPSSLFVAAKPYVASLSPLSAAGLAAVWFCHRCVVDPVAVRFSVGVTKCSSPSSQSVIHETLSISSVARFLVLLLFVGTYRYLNL